VEPDRFAEPVDAGTEGRAILDEILDKPGDRTLRLILADWLYDNPRGEVDEARAEFIRLQCRKGEEKGLSKAERRLLVDYGDVWAHDFVHGLKEAKLGDWKPCWTWKWGFVDTVACDLTAWHRRLHTCVTRHPISLSRFPDRVSWGIATTQGVTFIWRNEDRPENHFAPGWSRSTIPGGIFSLLDAYQANGEAHYDDECEAKDDLFRAGLRWANNMRKAER